MKNLLLIPVLVALVTSCVGGAVRDGNCPKVCTCETTVFSSLPINSVLVKAQHKDISHEHIPSQQSKNEVLDETNEQEAEHSFGDEQLRAVTCVLQSSDNLNLLLSLPSQTQVLTLLHGLSIENITLDESYFENLHSLVVLEIHGSPHTLGHVKLRNKALKKLSLLQYLNLQHVHLLGDRSYGNRPAPVSRTQYLETYGLTSQGEDNNIVPEAIQLVPQERDSDIVPYRVYREQQERAGLSSFANLNGLVFLRAFHCGIKEVNWEMFEGLQKLQYLSLEGNKIPFIDEFAFYGTPNLKHLVISHNKLLDLQSLSLAGLLNLETLDLSYNNISHLTEFSIPPLPALVTADFHHNPLETILPYTFQVMNNTQQLYLGGKKAKLEIRPNSFIGFNKLQKMSINGIQLGVLEREYLKGMPHLKEIRLEGTIHELSFDAFAEVPKLQELIIKNCSIRKISMDAFYGLYELIFLDLSHNELQTLPPSLFDHQRSLKEINLHNNKLTTLPAGIFIYTKAKLIRLDKNPWHCTCLMNEWEPSQINKMKVKITDNSLCQSRYDKGSMCSIHHMYQYVYEQSVTPRCATPTRYNNWSVFHLLRKHLRCDKLIYKQKALKSKPVKVNRINHKISHNHTSEHPKIESEVTVNEHPTTLPSVSDSNKTNGTGTKSNTEQPSVSTLRYVIEGQDTNIGLNKTKDINIGKKKTGLIIDTPDNQHMWTDRNREKYKLLLKKEKMLESKFKFVTATKKTDTQDNVKIHIDPLSKTKKRSDIRKKWEQKMRNTMENLNEVPKSETDLP
ncbi:insulin-like growth factor-binding protein complex acid labile subunit [Macrosteles quadrilineatus]|uniref:insulin-like growth factor-binding protein complex acid labile subunit n=1 Tax=Macrosteles quadrilineatus TaxID=74068 RepID=UPI0023E0C940|nr:insulin-like growth factor-binding protein complex acid labile subunit [Macrosteles quadrilineatus]